MDQKQTNWNELREKLVADALRQTDEIVTVGSLEISDSETPFISYGENGTKEKKKAMLGPRALRQLCGVIHVPHNFVSKMDRENRSRVMNEFVEKSKTGSRGDERQITLRLHKGEGDRDHVRAVLPGQYSPISDLLILDTAREIATERGLKIVNGSEGPRDGNWVIRMIHEGHVKELGIYNRSDKTYPGFEIVHSSVGDTNLGGNPLTWQLVCSNGLMGLRGDQNVGINRVYRGLTEPMVARDLTNAFEITFEASIRHLETMAKSRNVLVSRDAAIEAIHQILTSSSTFKSKQNEEAVLKNFEASRKPYGAGADRQYSVHQIVTRMTEDAQQFDWIVRRKLETEAARYMDEMLEVAA